MNYKPGLKTSEFWMSLLANIFLWGAKVLESFGYLPEGVSPGQLESALVTMVTVAFYIWSRTRVKEKAGG